MHIRGIAHYRKVEEMEQQEKGNGEAGQSLAQKSTKPSEAVRHFLFTVFIISHVNATLGYNHVITQST